MTKENIDKYKDQAKYLSHFRIGDDYSGYIWLNGNIPIGACNVRKSDNYIQAIEVSKDYQHQGLGKEILDICINEFKANKLSVNKKNKIAYDMYIKRGFKVDSDDDTMYYMSLKTSVKENDEELNIGFLNESNKINQPKKMYHLSQYNLDGKIIRPTIPNNFFTKNNYEENSTPRVCFSDSIDKCIMALNKKCEDEELFVHIPDGKYTVYKPNKNEVPDTLITKELWIESPVKMKCIGKIKIIGDSGEDGLKFSYGDKTAELYHWDYKWIEKYKI